MSVHTEMNDPEPRTSDPGHLRCLLVGATGLVGRECLRLLMEDDAYGVIHVLTRRSIDGVEAQAKVVQHVADFDEFLSSRQFPRIDHVFCALGTTMAKAGSRQAFRRVDFEYVLRIARMALEAGARHFVLVSSMSASKHSLFFYSRVKGEIEEAIAELGYDALTIVRPSVIAGDRPERRFGEELGIKLLRYAPTSIRPVHAGDIAAAMINAARTDPVGKRLIVSKAIPRRREVRSKM